jgi:hypothetical protein
VGGKGVGAEVGGNPLVCVILLLKAAEHPNTERSRCRADDAARTGCRRVCRQLWPLDEDLGCISFPEVDELA